MSRGRYAVGWVVVAVAAPIVAFAAVAIGRQAVGGSSVVDALSPAQVSAALSDAASTAPSATAPHSGGVPSTRPSGVQTATTGPHPTATTSPTSASSPTRSAGPSGQSTHPTPRPSPSGPPSSPATPAPTTALLTSTGGSVVAQCSGHTVYLVSWSPAQGFHVNGVQRGPGEAAEIEFESDHQSSSVHVTCPHGVPVQQVGSSADGGVD